MPLNPWELSGVEQGAEYAEEKRDEERAHDDPSGLCKAGPVWVPIGSSGLCSKDIRPPDYVTIDVAGGPVPLLGRVTVAEGQLTITRFGDLFLGPQLGFGVPGVCGAIRAGWLNQTPAPCQSAADQFVGGASLTASGYYPVLPGIAGPAVAETWGNEGALNRGATSNELISPRATISSCFTCRLDGDP